MSFVWRVIFKKIFFFYLKNKHTGKSTVYIWFLLEVLQNNDNFLFWQHSSFHKTTVIQGQILLFRNGVTQGHKLRRERGGLSGILRKTVTLETCSTHCFLKPAATGRTIAHQESKALNWGLHVGLDHRLRAERAKRSPARPQKVLSCYFFESHLKLWEKQFRSCLCCILVMGWRSDIQMGFSLPLCWVICSTRRSNWGLLKLHSVGR